MNRYSSIVNNDLFHSDSQDNNKFENHFTKRIKILKETILAFQSNTDYFDIAFDNLKTWQKSSCNNNLSIHIVPYDWGVATLKYTKLYGNMFTVLNMANPHYPGGGYLQGCAAQEENMFRRSNCHFSIKQDHFDFINKRYSSNMTNLLSAKDNMVYLDKDPRICIRNKENLQQENLGYEWLDNNEIFPFLEMRAAAQDCRYSTFNEAEANRRIEAQFNTLIANNIQYVVLGAFGCGAFNNPSQTIANLYKNCINKFSSYFKVIVFSVYHAGYGPDNYSVFKNTIPQS